MQRICTLPECGKSHRAKGLCSTHYNQILQPDRHLKVTVECGQCGESCSKDATRHRRYSNLFCGMDCRDAWARRQADLRKLPALFTGTVVYRPKPRPRVIAVIPKPRLWIAGRCAHCSAPFVDRQPQARYCSVVCGKRYWRRRTKKQAGVRPSVRLRVFRRDGWICQICMKRILRQALAPHALSPSIDHIVPRSQGGTHDPANLRAAHFLCNALRGDRGGDEQLALWG